jgi:sigma-B regulation protein RsbU (phosphoserine phosphatase)
LPGEPRRLGIVIADVVGKGVPAALYMALCRTVIRATALNGGSPSTVLAQANETILKESDSDLFLTAFYATLDTQSGRLLYTSAGHNPPLWLQQATDTIQELATLGIVLGAFPGIELEECEIDLAPGDRLVFYTDGVTEAMNPHRQFFGEDGLLTTVASQKAGNAQQTVKAVVDAVDAHSAGTPQSDDITLFVARRNHQTS